MIKMIHTTRTSLVIMCVLGLLRASFSYIGDHTSGVIQRAEIERAISFKPSTRIPRCTNQQFNVLWGIVQSHIDNRPIDYPRMYIYLFPQSLISGHYAIIGTNAFLVFRSGGRLPGSGILSIFPADWKYLYAITADKFVNWVEFCKASSTVIDELGIYYREVTANKDAQSDEE